MIKTTELMLGNLVEYRNKYYVVGTIFQNEVLFPSVYGRINCKDINPIPLTEGVLKRLGAKMESVKSVHELQNNLTIMNCKPLDITPLLSPRYTTHDGVEVWDGDLVYYTIINSYINPQQIIVSKSNMDKIGYIFFSTLDACLSYNDSLTRKPIFTTEDGVDVFEGDKYWYCNKLGRGLAYSENAKGNLLNEGNGNIRFSTQQLAQAYLNKVWAENEYNDLISKK